jgi:hypothetical protein
MKFKFVKLLLVSALFFAVLFATPMFKTNNHADMTVNNLAHKLASEGHPDTILVGDPVRGGVPCEDQCVEAKF